MENLYQIKVSLNDVKPEIWRRILVDEETLLPDLHKILQTTMGWENCHLHQFICNDLFYSQIDEDGKTDNFQINYSGTKVSTLLKKTGDEIVYQYDFGDSWEHKLTLEKIQPAKADSKKAVCLEGEKACPPEDCGGPGGYAELLSEISDPKSPEYAEAMEWLGSEFDPDKINLAMINESLEEDDFGCFEFEEEEEDDQWEDADEAWDDED